MGMKWLGIYRLVRFFVDSDGAELWVLVMEQYQLQSFLVDIIRSIWDTRLNFPHYLFYSPKD